jgi:hypothetical protein
MKSPLSTRQAIGRAQISRLEEEYRALLKDPQSSTQAQILLGWLESILAIGTSQLLWERSLGRAIEELEALRQHGAWAPRVSLEEI